MVLVLWLGGVEVIAGRITVGDFVAFGFYLIFLIWPMIALGWVVNLYQRGAASMGRLNRILRAEPRVPVPTDPVPLDEAEGLIEFRDVSFRYPGTERTVLDGVSFVAEAGQTVALVGPTGSGKSTLVTLVARLYDPTGGRITLDGIPLTRTDPGQLRRRIGMVPQDAFLFSETIEGNIGLGLDDREVPGTPGDPSPRWKPLPASPSCTIRSRPFRSATPPCWANGASTCRGARSSGPPSPAPWPAIRSSSSSTTP